jgi:hypothetical protein
VKYILRAYGIKVTFSETQVIYGIQDIGLAHTVPAHKAVDLAIELKIPAVKIFILYKGNFL